MNKTIRTLIWLGIVLGSIFLFNVLKAEGQTNYPPRPVQGMGLYNGLPKALLFSAVGAPSSNPYPPQQVLLEAVNGSGTLGAVLTDSNGNLLVSATSIGGVTIPTLATGYLYYNGSAFSWAAAGGGMVYPGAGIPVSTGTAWGTSVTAPTGTIVGTTDTQTLTNKSIANTEITGLGTASTVNTGTSGATIPLLNGTNTWSNAQTFSAAGTFGGSANTFNNAAAAENDVIIQAGSGAASDDRIFWNNYNAVTEWKEGLDTSYTYRINDTVTAIDRLILFQGGQTVINSAGTGSVAINNTSSSGTGGFIVYEGGTNNGVAALTINSSGNSTFGSASGSGNVAIGNHLNQQAAGDFGGTCTMSSATSCTFSLQHSYTSTPICVAGVQSATVIAGSCTISSGTVTITAASSNSSTWNAVLIGNPY